MSDNTARLAGYTREVEGKGVEGNISLHLFVKPGTDLESRFRAYDADECKFIHLNGWMFEFAEVTK